MDQPIDSIPGYTFSQRITDDPLDGEEPSKWSGFWSPLFHFLPISVPELDLKLYHHFSWVWVYSCHRERADPALGIRLSGLRTSWQSSPHSSSFQSSSLAVEAPVGQCCIATFRITQDRGSQKCTRRVEVRVADNRSGEMSSGWR